LIAVSASVWRNIASVLAAIIIWELAARYLIDNPLFLSPLSSVAVRGVELWSEGELQEDMWVSFVEFACGFAAAVFVGLGFGVIMAASRIARDFFDPWMSLLYATPILALGPLFILWFGIGVVSKIAVIFLVAMFPILVNSYVGLTTTDPTLIEVARSLGASGPQIYVKVRLPAALPYILAGLRLGTARALVGVVVAEMFGARAGLGFLILASAQRFDTAALFVGVFILAIAGVISVEFLKWLEARLAPWRLGDAEE
jgi:NitT/TauT family transport system permease protein